MLPYVEKFSNRLHNKEGSDVAFDTLHLKLTRPLEVRNWARTLARGVYLPKRPYFFCLGQKNNNKNTHYEDDPRGHYFRTRHR